MPSCEETRKRVVSYEWPLTLASCFSSCLSLVAKICCRRFLERKYRGSFSSTYLVFWWKSGSFLQKRLRPYAFDIFTNSRLIIYMTLKAIVATKIVEYKKRGINQYVRSLKRLDCLVVRQKGHWNKVSRKPLKLARCKCLIINSSNMQFQVSQNRVFSRQVRYSLCQLKWC